MHDVIAAITTAPWSSVNSSPFSLDAHAMAPGRVVVLGTGDGASPSVPAGACSVVGSLAGNVSASAPSVVRSDAERVERLAERLLRAAERHAVLRAARPGERRLDAPRSSSTTCEYPGASPARARARSPCSTPRRARRARGRPVKRRYSSVSSSTGKKPHVAPYSGDMFPSVARSATGSAGEPLAEVLDELADDAGLAQQLGHGEHEVGRGRAFAQPAVEAEADDLRHEHRQRLAEHRRLGLDPADAPAEHAEAVDHRRVRVGADERVRERDAVALLDHAGEELEVDLVADPGAGRHDLEVGERALAPAQERVALAVALELQLDVAARRPSGSRTRRPAPSGRSRARPGSSGLICAGSPPSWAIASRIAARSTTAGTPVKSCSSTRAGRERDLARRLGRGSHVATAWMPASSPARRAPSSRTRSVYGSRSIATPRNLRQAVDAIRAVADRERGTGCVHSREPRLAAWPVSPRSSASAATATRPSRRWR